MHPKQTLASTTHQPKQTSNPRSKIRCQQPSHLYKQCPIRSTTRILLQRILCQLSGPGQQGTPWPTQPRGHSRMQTNRYRQRRETFDQISILWWRITRGVRPYPRTCSKWSRYPRQNFYHHLWSTGSIRCQSRLCNLPRRHKKWIRWDIR